MKYLIPLLLATASLQAATLKSPDGKISAELKKDAAGQLVYSLCADGTPLLDESPLNISLDNKQLGQSVTSIQQGEVRKIDETYSLIGNHPTIRSCASETTFEIEAQGIKYGLVVRVGNDGVAFRYLLPESATLVTGEKTSWCFPKSIKKIVWQGMSSCYENYTFYTSFSEIPEEKTFLGPLTVEVGDYFLCISEADCQAFPDMAFRRKGNQLYTDHPSSKTWRVKADFSKEPRVKLNGTYLGRIASPWRYIVVAKELNDLLNSDMLTNLCPPPMEDFSWVKPGRAMWQWWSVGEPMYPDQKNWYDATATLKWEYYMIDDGWRVWKEGSRGQWELLKECVDYGNSIGVKTLAWVNSKEMRDAPSRRSYLEKIKACGVVGIKIDFIPDATQDIMIWYLGAIQDCADLKLLVNFHGAVKPTGLRRTLPNDITREGVRGNEWQMTRYKRIMPAEQYTVMPFSRFLAGPADITSTMLDPVQLETGKFTWPNQMAQLVVFLSPVTHFCDQYKFYVNHPAKDLFEEVPVEWDETRVLKNTKIGEVVVYARRKGNVWWLGAINNSYLREIDLAFDFLKKPGKAVMIYDDPKVNAAIKRVEETLQPGDVRKILLRPSGGFFAKISE